MENQNPASLPVVAGIEIPMDAEGRYNLNALHKASGGESNKAPAQWQRTQQAQDFIQEIIDMQICTSPISAKKGGADQGTFAHELIAVEYAGWISPRFRITVNQTFIDYRTGKYEVKPTNSFFADIPTTITALKIAPIAARAARAFGFTGNQAALSVDRAVKAITGESVLALMGHTYLIGDKRGRTYTPTDLGKMTNPQLSARKINTTLEAYGLQIRNIKSEWVPLERANDLYEWVDTGKRHSDGTPVKQLRWFSEVLDQLGLDYQAQEDFIGDAAAMLH